MTGLQKPLSSEAQCSQARDWILGCPFPTILKRREVLFSPVYRRKFVPGAARISQTEVEGVLSFCVKSVTSVITRVSSGCHICRWYGALLTFYQFLVHWKWSHCLKDIFRSQSYSDFFCCSKTANGRIKTKCCLYCKKNNGHFLCIPNVRKMFHSGRFFLRIAALWNILPSGCFLEPLQC